MFKRPGAIAAAFLLLLSLSAAHAQKRFLIWDEHGKFGYIDETGRVVIKPQFDHGYPFTQGLAAVSVGGKWGFIDAGGNQVVPFQYVTVAPFSDGVAAVTVKQGAGKNAPRPCGYIDRTNKYVIQLQTEFSCPQFQEGFVAIEVYDKYVGESLGTYMNKEGLQGVASRLAVAKPFSEGLALVNDFAKWYFVDGQGREVIDLRPKNRADTFADRYEPISSFSEGLALVGIEVSGTAGYSRYAFMSRHGRMVFELAKKMTPVGDFHDGRAQVYVEDSRKRRVRVGDEIWDDWEELSARGFIDATGRLVIAPRFSRAEDFSEGLAVVRVGKGLPIDYYNISDDRWKEYAENEAKYYSCIDRNGRVVIEKCGEPLPDEEIAENFQEFGRAFGRGFIDGLFFSKTQVRAGGKLRKVYGYMNRAGRYVWIQPPERKFQPPAG